MNHSSNLFIGGSMLTENDLIKYLEVIIYNTTTWIPYITYVKNKV